MITLCGSTYAKFVCSIILKQPSYILMCSSFIEFKLQAHSILESNSSRILFFFFYNSNHTTPSFLFQVKGDKKINLLQLIYQYFRLVRRFYLMERLQSRYAKKYLCIVMLFLYNSIYLILI